MTTAASPPVDPPPVGPRGLALRAALEGKRAGEAGASPSSCPYAGTSRPFTRRAWLLGYVAGRKAKGTLPAPDLGADEAPVTALEP